MGHGLFEVSLAASALVLCFLLAWRAPLLGLALGAAAGASLWAQPQGELALRVALLGAALLGAALARPRASAPLVELVALVGERWRARRRRPSWRAVAAARVASRVQVSGMGRSSH